jgi:hypothetical protein
MMGEPNTLLDALLDEAGISRAGLSSRVNASTARTSRPTSYDHTSVGRWIEKSAVPRGRAPLIICEILSEKIGRPVTLAEIGMEDMRFAQREASLRQNADQAIALWRGDAKRSADDPIRTKALRGASAIAPVFEWENPPDDVDVSQRGSAAVGLRDVERIRDARNRYEEMYRRVGGLPVRPRVLRFLNHHATPLLRTCLRGDRETVA